MSLKPARVLIADDSNDFSTMLSYCISLYPDIEVVGIAQNGIEALNMLHKFQPDVLLLDIIMPEMDGLEVLQKLSEQGSPAPFVFVLSAVSSESIAYQSVNLGAAYLLKPIDTRTIISKIRDVMNLPE